MHEQVSGSAWAADAQQQRHDKWQHGQKPSLLELQDSFASFQMAAGYRSLQQQQSDGAPTGAQGAASGGGFVDENRPRPPPLVPLPLPLTMPLQTGADVSMTVLPTLLNL